MRSAQARPEQRAVTSGAGTAARRARSRGRSRRSRRRAARRPGRARSSGRAPAPTARRARRSRDAAAATAVDACRSPSRTRARRRSGTTAAATIPSSGVTSTAAASHSLVVTEAPQRCGVAGTELGEDPLVEDAGDERDQQQVDGDADLDRERRGRPGELSAASASPFSTSTMPSTWNSVARRVAAVTSPIATRVSVARSAACESSPIGGMSQMRVSASSDRGGGTRERRHARPDRARLARAADEEEQQRREHDASEGERGRGDGGVRGSFPRRALRRQEAVPAR